MIESLEHLLYSKNFQANLEEIEDALIHAAVGES